MGSWYLREKNMTEEEKKKLWADGDKRFKTIGHAVREVFSPQIKQHAESYYDYLKDVSTTAGILLGGVVALWSTNKIDFVSWLAIMGFLFLAISVVFSFYLRKNSVTIPVPYVLSVKKLSRKVTEHSHKIVLFSRNELTVEEYLEEKKRFEDEYQKMRSSVRFEEMEKKETAALKRMSKWYSEINILTLLLLLGIICILLSVLIPQLCLLKYRI